MHIFAQSLCLRFCNNISEKWRHTEAHKLDPVTVACQRLRSQAANSRPIIRLIAMAINFNLDMKEFWGGFYIANYSHSLQPMFRAPGQDTCFMPETDSGG